MITIVKVQKCGLNNIGKWRVCLANQTILFAKVELTCPWRGRDCCDGRLLCCFGFSQCEHHSSLRWCLLGNFGRSHNLADGKGQILLLHPPCKLRLVLWGSLSRDFTAWEMLQCDICPCGGSQPLQSVVVAMPALHSHLAASNLEFHSGSCCPVS